MRLALMSLLMIPLTLGCDGGDNHTPDPPSPFIIDNSGGGQTQGNPDTDADLPTTTQRFSGHWGIGRYCDGRRSDYWTSWDETWTRDRCLSGLENDELYFSWGMDYDTTPNEDYNSCADHEYYSSPPSADWFSVRISRIDGADFDSIPDNLTTYQFTWDRYSDYFDGEIPYRESSSDQYTASAAWDWDWGYWDKDFFCNFAKATTIVSSLSGDPQRWRGAVSTECREPAEFVRTGSIFQDEIALWFETEGYKYDYEVEELSIVAEFDYYKCEW